MPCVVPTCGAAVGTFKPFPQHMALADRWLGAIHVGCGVKVAECSSEDLGLQQICQWHFGKPTAAAEAYQEPSIFFNCKEAQEVAISSCRMCLRFFRSCDTVSMDGELAERDIKSVFCEYLGINLQSDSFLEQICCFECLARLELLKSIQNAFLNANDTFQHLLSLTQDTASADLPLSVEVIMHDDDDREESQSDGAIVEDDSDDEWTPLETSPKIVKRENDAPVKRRGRKRIVRNDSEKQELPSKDLLARTCYICSLVVEHEDELSSHLAENHSNSSGYRCEECSLDFPLLFTYNKHLSRHDPTGRPFKCEFCALHFKVRLAKKVHENTHHGSNHAVRPQGPRPKSIICETCGIATSSLSKLRRHVNLKHSSTKEKPSCKICGKSFAAKFSLDRHMLLHMNQKPYVCKMCDTPFRRPLDLKFHVQKVHEGKNPHVCDTCNQEFQTYYQLHRHKQFVHRNKAKPGAVYAYSQNPYEAPRFRTGIATKSCQLCKEPFPNGSALEKHIESSHADEPYPVRQCPHCPRTFVSVQSFYTHKARHTDKCVCQECGKRFSSAQRLRNHVESIHEGRQFNCPICQDKTYKSQSALQAHMALHTKGKRFQCEFCDKKFLKNFQLTIHRRTHTGEKPFECPNCTKRFGDDGTFCKHKKRCMATKATSYKVEEQTSIELPSLY